MILEVVHRTSYAYGQPVSIAHHLLHLAPRVTERQEVHQFRLTIDPVPTLVRDAVDFFGNTTSIVTLEREHAAFVVTAHSRVELRSRGKIVPERSVRIGRLGSTSGQPEAADLLDIRQFLFDSPSIRCPDELHVWAGEVLDPDRPVLAAALDLNHRIHAQFAYDPSATSVGTSVEECFALRRGVCQDFAHLMLAALRSHRIPARYVSGYLRTYAPPGKERLVGSDASHAWVQVWAPPYGWVDLDPTNDLIPDVEHVTLAFGRDFGDVSPINGIIFGGGAHLVEVEVDVIPVAPPGTAGPDAEAG
ncbi:transglutaminase family protein [Geminicoccus roseus]|uniref:transglutaminase family protein n=1 Tax=Geminicoccus roseus TaxID=404900 RepID=UPI0003FF6CB1|nr:transglutaminase family protein [Geminicoccus roseus]